MGKTALAPVVEATELAWRGIECCRAGDWQQGMYYLTLVAGMEPEEEGRDLPGLFFAYLGYGLARFENKKREGIELCRQAVMLEFHQPESYVFLAQTCLLFEDRRSAIDAIDRGLEIDSTCDDLVALRRQLGRRRPPILAFLPRGHVLNRALGKVRHRLFGYVREDG